MDSINLAWNLEDNAFFLIMLTCGRCIWTMWIKSVVKLKNKYCTVDQRAKKLDVCEDKVFMK